MRRAVVGRAALLAASLSLLGVGLGSAQPPVAPRRVWIGASGDILFHTRLLATADAHGGFDHVFSGLREVLSSEEIAFANLETPLSIDRAPMRGDPPRLGAPPEAAGALARAGIDVLSVANNHVWDQSHLGLADTLRAVREAGMVSVGSAETDELAPGPVVVERDGVRVAFVAWTDHIQGHPGTRRPAVRVAMYERQAVRRALEAARAQADVVVASMHWGQAYRHESRSDQRAAAAYLIEHGADVVLGHGPHVLQPVERASSPRGEALVAYSLGNLVSNQGYLYRRGRREAAELPLREPATRDGVWLRVAVDVVGPGQVRIGVVEGVPLWTHNNHWDVERRVVADPDVRVLPLASVEDLELGAERRARIGGVLGPLVRLAP
jgi:poly-gamma-glutamate synthesis protein (capsule biosynthesis protein)